MSLYLISYDLDKPGQNYDKLIARLKELGAQRCLYSQWFLANTAGHEAVRNDLQRFMDQNDRILVVALKNAAAWYNLMLSDKTVVDLFTNHAG